MVEGRIVVLVSADSEWRSVVDILSPRAIQSTRMGESFQAMLGSFSVRFFHGGWGKVSAAATTQFVIDIFHPVLLVNIGTCGGFKGHINKGAVILVEQTLIYDIVEQMSDPDEAITHYATKLDLSFLPEPMPHPVRRGLLVSADRDLLPADIPPLREKFGAVAADWESGAIAWVAQKNDIPLMILRAVTDLVDQQGSETYGNIQVFHASTRQVMEDLLDQLPGWLEHITEQ